MIPGTAGNLRPAADGDPSPAIGDFENYTYYLGTRVVGTAYSQAP
jgi:hypothetical protein